jgi:cell division septation protein DedD
MSPENKQRIVGVVVLMAFIALLVPFLFSSGIRKKLSTPADEIPINAQKRQLITQQIQNINTTNTAPAATTTTTADAVVTPTSVTGQQTINTAQLSGLPQDQIEQPDALLPPEENDQAEIAKNVGIKSDEAAPAMNTSNATIQPSANSVVSVESAAPVVPPKTLQKNKITKSKVMAKNKNANTGAKEFWSVQVGSFSDEARMQNLITQLRSNGFNVYTQKIVTASTKSLTRVLVGHEVDKVKASKIAKQLETTMKVKGHLVRN